MSLPQFRRQDVVLANSYNPILEGVKKQTAATYVVHGAY